MPKINIPIHLPGLLTNCTNGKNPVIIQAENLSGCFIALCEAYPLLKVHLFSEDGKQREHVLFFYNDENIQWLDNQNIPLKAGDTLTILQAVSGG